MTRPELQRWERPALAGMLLLALALRAFKLDSPLWYDEIQTLTGFVHEPFGKLVADYSSFNNHLFYSLQAKLSIALFGESNWAFRLPAALFGVGSIWMIWRLARLALGAGEAMAVAALLTLSYHHIWFSQNARGYTELMFWSLAALALFIQAMGTRSWKLWGGFGLTLAAAMYTHITAGFIVATLGLVYLAMLACRLWLPTRTPQTWQAPADWPGQVAPFLGFVFGGVVTLALCAPAIPQMFALVGTVKETSGVDVMQEYQNPLWALLEGIRTVGGESLLIMLAAPVAGVLAIIGAVSLLRRQPVLTAVGAGHILVTLAALLVLHMRIWPRFFFTDIAFVMLFLTHGAFVVCGWVAALTPKLGLRVLTKPRLIGLAVTVMVIASAGLAVRNYQLPKQNLPAPVALIAKNGGTADSVGAVGWAGDIYDKYPVTGWRKVETVADLGQLSTAHGRRWLVVIFPARTFRRNAEVMKIADRDFEIVQRFPGTLGEGGVWVYGSKPVPAPAP